MIWRRQRMGRVVFLPKMYTLSLKEYGLRPVVQRSVEERVGGRTLASSRFFHGEAGTNTEMQQREWLNRYLYWYFGQTNVSDCLDKLRRRWVVSRVIDPLYETLFRLRSEERKTAGDGNSERSESWSCNSLWGQRESICIDRRNESKRRCAMEQMLKTDNLQWEAPD